MVILQAKKQIQKNRSESMNKNYLLGYDIGTSSVKAALVDAETGSTVASAQYPDSEAPILSKQAGWAEQEPKM